MGAAAIPYIISAAGAGMQYYNTQQTAKRQDNELARQIIAQGKRTNDADQLLQRAIVDTRASNPDDERRAALSDYMGKLQQTQGNAEAGLGQIGAVSDRYTADAQGAAHDIAETGQGTADIFSRMDAPVRQREGEGILFGRLASDLDRVRALSDSDAYLGDLRMRRIRPNAFLDAAAQVAQGYGQASAGSWGGGSTSSGGYLMSGGPSSAQLAQTRFTA